MPASVEGSQQLSEGLQTAGRRPDADDGKAWPGCYGTPRTAPFRGTSRGAAARAEGFQSIAAPRDSEPRGPRGGGKAASLLA